MPEKPSGFSYGRVLMRRMDIRESIIEHLTLIPKSVRLNLSSYLPSVITFVVDMICTEAGTVLGHLLLDGESYPDSHSVELKGKWLEKFTPGLRDYMSSCSLK